jgi:hypothetical protein
MSPSYGAADSTARFRPTSFRRHSFAAAAIYHRRTLLSDYDCRRVGVGRGDGRHHRGIDDPAGRRGRAPAARCRPPPSRMSLSGWCSRRCGLEPGQALFPNEPLQSRRRENRVIVGGLRFARSTNRVPLTASPPWTELIASALVAVARMALAPPSFCRAVAAFSAALSM